jgi:cobalt-precorrin-5B (C1)-methyltransferase
VVKDAGDDPDVTNGMRIYATARKIPGTRVEITAGRGIGTVTMPGLAVSPGRPAINPVPMKMIIEAVESVKPDDAGVLIEISAPKGAEIAKKTFNPRLGIRGGISILGTTGIVEPYSDEAVIESLALRLSLMAAEGLREVIFVPGKYGERYAIDVLGLPRDLVAVTGNYVGKMLERAVRHGMRCILFVGHIGKLVKIAGGIFDTHSRVADARVEILAAHYGTYSGDMDAVKNIMGSVTTEGAVAFIADRAFFDYLAGIVAGRCAAYTGGAFDCEVVLFSEKTGELGRSGGADSMIMRLKKSDA